MEARSGAKTQAEGTLRGRSAVVNKSHCSDKAACSDLVLGDTGTMGFGCAKKVSIERTRSAAKEKECWELVHARRRITESSLRIASVLGTFPSIVLGQGES